MGLFSKPEPFTRHRHCVLRRDHSVVLELVLRTWPYELLTQETAPAKGGVYFSEASKSRFVLAGGNREQTFWNVIVEVDRHPDGTQLTVYADRPGKQMQFNDLAAGVIMDLRRALAAAGGSFPDWDGMDAFAMLAIPRR